MQLRFLGAAREVTGSCFLLETGRAKVLIDCGLIQGRPADEARNREPFPFAVEDIDAVVLTHAHLDHSGRLPLLIKSGYRQPIYTQRASRDLCRIMLKDAGHLQEKDAEWENRKRERKGLQRVEALYTVADAQATMRYFRAMDYDVERLIAPGVWLRLYDAGHILGSAIVELRVQDDRGERILVFSGDLGHSGAPILRDPVRVRRADLVVMESTYGERQHRSWDSTWEELHGVVREARAARGNILVPSFAIGRAQLLLYVLKQHYHDWGLEGWQLFVDSPMAIEATEVYARHWRLYDQEATQVRREDGDPFRPPNLHLSRTSNQSMAINKIRSGALIIAGSGMCTGGRIKHHLKHNLWRSDCHVIMVGFQARGTLGRALVDGARHVRLWGETIRVGAKIHTVGGLSAHADQHGLMDWYAGFDGHPPVALVHGEEDAMRSLGETLQGRGVQVSRPRPGEVLKIT
ncbi:MAG: MBL fold metallo-hydrolase [Gammaproteobacteria bacterium]|nr:MBL fold metallo-hydrolase [Gammaproteobacteria bacterium]